MSKRARINIIGLLLVTAIVLVSGTLAYIFVKNPLFLSYGNGGTKQSQQVQGHNLTTPQNTSNGTGLNQGLQIPDQIPYYPNRVGKSLIISFPQVRKGKFDSAAVLDGANCSLAPYRAGNIDYWPCWRISPDGRNLILGTKIRSLVPIDEASTGIHFWLQVGNPKVHDTVYETLHFTCKEDVQLNPTKFLTIDAILHPAEGACYTELSLRTLAAHMKNNIETTYLPISVVSSVTGPERTYPVEYINPVDTASLEAPELSAYTMSAAS